jgi:predicted enzyme related to lactoylglutathione lyase
VREFVGIRGNIAIEEGEMAARVVHVEFPAGDADRAQGFYEGLFGWQFSQPMPEMDYRMSDLGEGQGAAVFPSDSGATGLKVYFGVDDIGAACAKVVELGGQAEDKAPVPGMGWFAACKDPEGNDFSLWQSDSAAG